MDADPIAFGACAWLLTYALHSTVLIAAAWLVTACSARLRSSRGLSTTVRERVWRVAMLGALVSASVQVATGFAPFSVRWSLAETVALEERTQTTLAPIAVADVSVPTPRLALHAPLAGTEAGPQTTSLPFTATTRMREPSATAESERATGTTSASPAATAPVVPLTLTWVRLVVAVWLAGAIVGAAWWALEWRRLFRCLRGRSPIQFGTARAVFDDLCRRTGVRTRVGLSSAAGISAPITFGLWRAEICLPPRTLDGLQREELEALLAHELAHAVRRDGAWLVVYRAIEILFFFQPLHRLARIRLQDDAEYLCDDWAVVHTGERVALASCLTEIAGWIVRERRLLPVPAMAARGSRLSLRVRRLLDEQHRPVRAARLPAATALAGAVIVAVAFCAPGVDAFETADEVAAELAASEVSERELDLAPPGVPDTDVETPAKDADPFWPGETSATDLDPEGETDPRGEADPDEVVEALDSALAIQAIADEITALERDFTVLAAAAGEDAAALSERFEAIGLRLRSLRERQMRVEALVQLQALWADTYGAPASALDAAARFPNG